jgi:hypothetical protein
MKVKLNKLKVRLETAWFILRGGSPHWFLVHLDTQNLENHLTGKQTKLGLNYHGLVEFNVLTLCRHIANSRDDVDYMLDKATYEAEAELARIEREKPSSGLMQRVKSKLGLK